ncbi:MAG: hypothetical protein AABX49_02400 [Nanoarchaeota archaeon]
MLEAVIIYLSIIFGKFLYALAKEEIKPGVKYIMAGRNGLILLVAIALIHSNFGLISILFTFFGLAAFIFLRRFSNLVYFLIGSATFLVLLTQDYMILMSFILLLAMTHSSMSSNKKELFAATIYFVLPFSLILIETFIKGNLGIFTSFIAGGLLAQLKKGP